MDDVKSQGGVRIIQIWTDKSPLAYMTKSRAYPTSRHSSKLRVSKIQILRLAKQEQFIRNRQNQSTPKKGNSIGYGIEKFWVSAVLGELNFHSPLMAGPLFPVFRMFVSVCQKSGSSVNQSWKGIDFWRKETRSESKKRLIGKGFKEAWIWAARNELKLQTN
jgi:hypothetical protein